MLNPAIGKLLEAYDSKYQLVLDVAHRARVIAATAEKNKISLEEKPVDLALNDLAHSMGLM